MKFSVLYVSCCFAFVCLFAACSKKNGYKDDPIRSEWLLPLIKGDIKPLNLTTLNNKLFRYEITAEDCGFQSGIPISMPIHSSIQNLNAFELETNTLIHSIHFDTCLININIINNFPVAIQSGTVLSIRTSPHSTALLSLTIEQDIANGMQSLHVFNLSGANVANTLYVTVDTLLLDTFSNVVFDGSLMFDIHINKLSVVGLELATNQQFEIRDTTVFDASTLVFDEADDRISDTMITAKLMLTCANELPVNLNLQLYFTDDKHQILDSLFYSSSQIEGAEYNGGALLTGRATEIETLITKQRIEKINKATQVVYSIQMNTNNYPSISVPVKKEQDMKLRIVGDLKLVLSSSVFDF